LGPAGRRLGLVVSVGFHSLDELFHGAVFRFEDLFYSLILLFFERTGAIEAREENDKYGDIEDDPYLGGMG
jgi:hypothetical protein